VADALVERWTLVPEKAAEAEGFGGTVGTEKVLVVKPTTYMNNSGDALAFLSYTNIDPARELLVITDDFALPHATFRLRPSGSAGGHNGLISIEQALGSDQYNRLRVGVGPLPPGVGDWAEFVLAPFTTDEQRVLDDLIPTMVDAVACWVQEGIEIAMTRYNKKSPAS
jgi:PTH1 family peptidyl-tRNA hydrolase